MRQEVPAWWNDGQTAARHAVTLHVYARELVVLDQARRELARWPYGGMQLAEAHYRGRDLRLAHREYPDARLLIEDPALQQWLAGRVPGYRGAADASPLRQRLVLAVVALIVAVGAMLWLLPRLAGPLAAVVPQAWEVELGRQVVAPMLADSPVCADPAGRQALEHLLQRLLEAAPTEYPVEVHVIDRTVVNALAAPGGQIVLFSGLIGAAQSPDELAGVLAHELAHVRERHGMEALIRQLGLSLLISAMVGDLSAAAALGGEAGRLLLALSFSRQVEAEADAEAVEMLRRAQIDTRGMARFFERLADEPADGPAWLSSHPPPALRGAIGHPDSPLPPVLEPVAWQTLQEICTRPER